MFYETSKNNHGLKYNPFKSCIIPRPIAWITTLTKEGTDNCAPYSFFNAISDKPYYVMFSSTGYKESIKNIDGAPPPNSPLASRGSNKFNSRNCDQFQIQRTCTHVV